MPLPLRWPAPGPKRCWCRGPVELAPPAGVKLMRVTTAREMLAACEAALPVDVAVLAAAVADWRPQVAANTKIKKADAKTSIALVENPDILAALANHARRPRLLIGFAAETDHVIENAVAKRARKGADWIVANDVSPITEENRSWAGNATGFTS